jgi:hypothetical protein
MEAMHLYTFMYIILDFPNSDFQPIYPNPQTMAGSIVPVPITSSIPLLISQ